MTKYQVIHACLDKPAYPTRGEALRKLYAESIKRETLIPTLRPYECPFGVHFHLGNTKENHV